MKKSKLYIAAIALLACIVNAYAQNWPQYLGAHRNSISDQKGI